MKGYVIAFTFYFCTLFLGIIMASGGCTLTGGSIKTDDADIGVDDISIDGGKIADIIDSIGNLSEEERAVVRKELQLE